MRVTLPTTHLILFILFVIFFVRLLQPYDEGLGLLVQLRELVHAEGGRRVGLGRLDLGGPGEEHVLVHHVGIVQVLQDDGEEAQKAGTVDLRSGTRENSNMKRCGRKREEKGGQVMYSTIIALLSVQCVSLKATRFHRVWFARESPTNLLLDFFRSTATITIGSSRGRKPEGRGEYETN